MDRKFFFLWSLTCFLLSPLFAQLLLSPASAATVRIHSVYRDAIANASAKELLWQVESEGQESFVRIEGDQQARLLLVYDHQGRLTKVEDLEQGIHNVSQGVAADRVLLSHGYPFPYDDIISDRNGPQQVFERKIIATTIFTRHYDRDVVPVLRTNVLAAGYVSPEIADQLKAEGFYWVILSRDGKVEEKQLWNSELNGWVYEEDSGRRSWRLNLD